MHEPHLRRLLSGRVARPPARGSRRHTRPFLAYAALLTALAPLAATLPRPGTAVTFASDPTVLRSRRFWAAAVAIMLAILATGALDGVLPLHFAQRWSQTRIGVAYLLVGALLAVGSAGAGHQPPARMLFTGGLAITVGLTVCGASPRPWVWALGLVLLGLGAGAAQQAQPDCCLPPCPRPASSPR